MYKVCLIHSIFSSLSLCVRSTSHTHTHAHHRLIIIFFLIFDLRLSRTDWWIMFTARARALVIYLGYTEIWIKVSIVWRSAHRVHAEAVAIRILLVRVRKPIWNLSQTIQISIRTSLIILFGVRSIIFMFCISLCVCVCAFFLFGFLFHSDPIKS